MVKATGALLVLAMLFAALPLCPSACPARQPCCDDDEPADQVVVKNTDEVKSALPPCCQRSAAQKTATPRLGDRQTRLLLPALLPIRARFCPMMPVADAGKVASVSLVRTALFQRRSVLLL